MKQIRRFLSIGLVIAAAAWPVLPAPAAPRERPATPSGIPTPCIPSDPQITATAGQPGPNKTSYRIQIDYADPTCVLLEHKWTKTGQHCGTFPVAQGANPAVWDYSTADCPPPPHPSATITDTVRDGYFVCTATYSGGSTSGTGPVGSCAFDPPHCEKTGTFLDVWPTSDGDPLIGREGDNLFVLFGGATQPVPSCTGNTIFNTGNIRLFGSALDNHFTLDLTGGPFGSSGSLIPIDIEGMGGNDQVTIDGDLPSVFDIDTDGPVKVDSQEMEAIIKAIESVYFDYPSAALDLTFVGRDGLVEEWTYEKLSEVAAQLIQTDPGGDLPPNMFQFAPGSLGAPLKVDAGGGNDTFNIFPAPSEPIDVQIQIDPVIDLQINPFEEPPVALQPQGFDAFSLGGGGGNLTVNGSGGNDLMTVESAGTGFQFAPNATPSSPGTPFGVIGFETFTLEGGGGGDTFEIEPPVFDEFNGGTGLLPFMIFGGTGVDGVRVTPPAPEPINYKSGSLELEVRAAGTAVFAALNTDAATDADAEFGAAEIEKLTLTGGSKKDKISGAGGAGTGTALEIPMIVKGAGGNDKLTGGKAGDKLDGGAGSNDTCVGGKGTDTFKGCETKKQ